MTEKEQDSSYDGRDVSKVFIPFSAMIRDFPNKPPQERRSVDRLLVTPRSLEDDDTCKFEVRRALGRVHGFRSPRRRGGPVLGHGRRHQGVPHHD